MTSTLTLAYICFLAIGVVIYLGASFITAETIMTWRGMEHECVQRIKARDTKIEELSERLMLRDGEIQDYQVLVQTYKETIRNNEQIIGGLRYEVERLKRGQHAP